MTNIDLVLGIESSCDETGVALYHRDGGLIGHQLYSQAALHESYGGVVPELASRDHVRKLLPLLQELLYQSDVRLDQIDGIAYTAGPGLIGALMVGAAFALGLARTQECPLAAIHHMEAHLLAPMLEPDGPTYPFVALLVSGGHTQLVRVDGLGCYKLLGDSIDDAVGEAFDKTAKLMGLGYPGGPRLAKLAISGDPGRYRLSRPMTDRPGLDFSFSGLKTQALTLLRNSDGRAQTHADLAHAFQEAIVDTLVIKSQRALDETGLSQLVVAGGVGANHRLRERLDEVMRGRNGRVHFPRAELCTDNGAMVAFAGFLRLRGGDRAPAREIYARARWPLDELRSPPLYS